MPSRNAPPGLWLPIALLTAGAIGAWSSDVPAEARAQIGAPAPAIEARPLQAASGGRDSSVTWDGRIVLLNIWASWCGPCRDEMPSLERLQRDLGPGGVRVVAVSVDEPVNAATVARFADSLGLTMELWLDANGLVRRAYGGVGIPETFLIDRSGIMRGHLAGAVDWSSRDARDRVRGLLRR